MLAGWVALTVAGSLLHLLAVLARVRHFAVKMPAPRAARDRIVTALAVLAVITSGTLAQAPGLSILDAPALALRRCDVRDRRAHRRRRRPRGRSEAPGGTALAGGRPDGPRCDSLADLRAERDRLALQGSDAHSVQRADQLNHLPRDGNVAFERTAASG